jgi:undecaprenyl-diphosphatase
MTPSPATLELDYATALVLGLVQGVTEFLPVSSSGHLSLARHLGLRGETPVPPAFDILLHLATLLVVLRSFWRDIRRVLIADRVVLWYLAVGTVPAVLTVLLAGDAIYGGLRQSPLAVAAALLVTAGLLYACDRQEAAHGRLRALGVGGAAAVGLAQALALVPGVSRSGATITGGVFAGLGREEAVRFSFLLFIPAILAAVAYTLTTDAPAWRSLPPGPSAVGFLAAFTTGFVCLELLKVMATQRRLRIFAVYCTAVAVATLTWVLLAGGA